MGQYFSQPRKLYLMSVLTNFIDKFVRSNNMRCFFSVRQIVLKGGEVSPQHHQSEHSGFKINIPLNRAAWKLKDSSEFLTKFIQRNQTIILATDEVIYVLVGSGFPVLVR